MDERREADHDNTINPARGARAAEGDDGSEGNETQSTPKYRRLDREGTRASIGPEHSGRFLFVDSSSSGQRPRSDQRAINAHIQQTAHRNRRQAAAQKLKGTGTANIGRFRREPQLQPRPIEPQRVPATVVDQENAPASRPARLSQSPEVDQEQLERLRHYSVVRGPEVRQAIDAQYQDDEQEVEAVQRVGPNDERALADNNSMRSMLAQILQRLDAGNPGHSIQGLPVSALRNTALDPFDVSAVTITPAMNSVLRHCKSVQSIPCFYTLLLPPSPDDDLLCWLKC